MVTSCCHRSHYKRIGEKELDIFSKNWGVKLLPNISVLIALILISHTSRKIEYICVERSSDIRANNVIYDHRVAFETIKLNTPSKIIHLSLSLRAKIIHRSVCPPQLIIQVDGE